MVLWQVVRAGIFVVTARMSCPFQKMIILLLEKSMAAYALTSQIVSYYYSSSSNQDLSLSFHEHELLLRPYYYY